MKKFAYNRVLNSAVLFLLILSASACNTQKPATGNEDEIFVIADTADYYEMEGTLLQVFGKVIYTPQPENLFELKRKRFDDLESIKKRKNIIILSTLESNSELGEYVKNRLDSTVNSMVEKNEEFVFNKYDLWARNQLVMTLVSPDLKQLNMNILREHDRLLGYFQKISNKRLFKSLYNDKYEKKEIEAKLLKNYGWMIYVQADFQLAKDVPEDNFVWLRRAINTDMERWIFIHWIDNATPVYLNSDSIASVRNRQTEKFYRTSDEKAYVEIADSYRSTTEVNFNGKYALMTQGLWRFNDKSGGGPFVSYTFYDEATKRIYFIDGSIYAPKYYKKKIIQQVDVILQSFMTEAQVNPEKREDLLDLID
ncbi:MAG: DUF4837 family protein [Bacteroidetes bacterium]|nr:DUF4837 family protein [Bacteroidota bacterium]